MSDPIVVILNWHGWRDTIACLESLFDASATPCRVIVCDNDSHDESISQISEWGRLRFGKNFENVNHSDIRSGFSLHLGIRLALVENGANLGFAGGNNVGIQLAMSDLDCNYVWLLNNDTEVHPDALRNLIARVEADDTIGLCGSTLIYHHERDRVQAFGGSTFNPYTGRSRHIGAFESIHAIPADPIETERNMSYVVGAAMLVRRAYLEQIGLMHEGYFLYYEEIDWCTRGKGKFRLGYAPDSHVFHKEGASIGTSASGGSPLSVYYLYRSRVRFTWRFYRWLLPLVLGACAWDIFKLLVKGHGAQARAAIKGTLQMPRVAKPKAVAA
jgi:GT2 family glycosyltransferase